MADYTGEEETYSFATQKKTCFTEVSISFSLCIFPTFKKQPNQTTEEKISILKLTSGVSSAKKKEQVMEPIQSFLLPQNSYFILRISFLPQSSLAACSGQETMPGINRGIISSFRVWTTLGYIPQNMQGKAVKHLVGITGWMEKTWGLNNHFMAGS